MPWRITELQMGLPYGYFDRIKENQDAREGRVSQESTNLTPEGHTKPPEGTPSLGESSAPTGQRFSPSSRPVPTEPPITG